MREGEGGGGTSGVGERKGGPLRRESSTKGIERGGEPLLGGVQALRGLTWCHAHPWMDDPSPAPRPSTWLPHKAAHITEQLSAELAWPHVMQRTSQHSMALACSITPLRVSQSSTRSRAAVTSVDGGEEEEVEDDVAPNAMALHVEEATRPNTASCS